MDLSTIEALYRYNAWANERTLDAVSRVSQADLVRDLKNSHASLRDTLTHIVWAEWLWLERWKGNSPMVAFMPSEFPDVQALRERFHAVAAERSSSLRDLRAERLAQEVEYRNMKGETWRYPLWQQLHHVVNHSTYHKGQITTMLRQLGYEPVPLDLLVYYDEGDA